MALVRKAMADQGEKLCDGRLELELTESPFLGGHDEDQQLFTDLTRAGVPLAIDDFGTGYSSFSYLIN
jgi:EAL domain-containing protein (putative c-di-GMP-specific phosphodiesterase class I)